MCKGTHVPYVALPMASRQALMQESSHGMQIAYQYESHQEHVRVEEQHAVVGRSQQGSSCCPRERNAETAQDAGCREDWAGKRCYATSILQSVEYNVSYGFAKAPCQPSGKGFAARR